LQQYVFRCLLQVFVENRDYQQTQQLFQKHKPTHVIHLAAFVGGLYRNMKYNVEFFNDNMAMNMNVMRCCHELKVLWTLADHKLLRISDSGRVPVHLVGAEIGVVSVHLYLPR